MKAYRTSINAQTLEETLSSAGPVFPFRTLRSGITGKTIHDGISPYPWHWHNEVELFTILSGAIRYSVPGLSQVFSAGDVGFINARVLHSTQFITLDNCFTLQHLFLPTLISGERGSLIDANYVQPLLKNLSAGLLRIPADHPAAKALRERITETYEAYQRRENGFELEIRSQLSAAWLTLLANSPNSVPARHREDDSRAKAILNYIETHYAEHLHLKDLAAAADICPREASRCFQRQLGVSPVAYLLSFRIRRAAELLRGSTLSITEISINCGFNSVSYFSSLFHRQFGTTPTEYRRTESIPE